MLNKDELDYMKKVLDATDRRLAEVDNHLSYLQANNSVIQSYYEKLATAQVEQDVEIDDQHPILKKALEIALGEVGEKEVPGSGNNPRIVSYWATIPGFNNSPDSVAWCSAYVQFCIQAAGGEGTGKANARSWLDWGVPTKHPKPGDIAIQWRGSPDSWTGHVFIVTEYDKNTGKVKGVGGNQSNKVSNIWQDESRILGYRTL